MCQKDYLSWPLFFVIIRQIVHRKWVYLMTKKKWGIMGSNSCAHEFAESFHLECTKLTAVSSRNLQEAFDFSRCYDITKAYGSHEELAYDPEIDIVFIAVPDNILIDTLLMALKAEKHVSFVIPQNYNERELSKINKFARKKKRLIAAIKSCSVESVEAKSFHTLCHSYIEKTSASTASDSELI